GPDQAGRSRLARARRRLRAAYGGASSGVVQLARFARMSRARRAPRGPEEAPALEAGRYRRVAQDPIAEMAVERDVAGSLGGQRDAGDAGVLLGHAVHFVEQATAVAGPSARGPDADHVEVQT